MRINVILDERVEKDLKKVPRKVKISFFQIIELLEKDPIYGIPLHGEFQGYRKVRIGNYRVLYKFIAKNNLIIITKVKSRQGVYKN